MRDTYSEVEGLIIDSIINSRLNLKNQKEYYVLWFDPPGENKLKYVKSWRREDQLELISEAK